MPRDPPSSWRTRTLENRRARAESWCPEKMNGPSALSPARTPLSFSLPSSPRLMIRSCRRESIDHSRAPVRYIPSAPPPVSRTEKRAHKKSWPKVGSLAAGSSERETSTLPLPVRSITLAIINVALKNERTELCKQARLSFEIHF